MLLLISLVKPVRRLTVLVLMESLIVFDCSAVIKKKVFRIGDFSELTRTQEAFIFLHRHTCTLYCTFRINPSYEQLVETFNSFVSNVFPSAMYVKTQGHLCPSGLFLTDPGSVNVTFSSEQTPAPPQVCTVPVLSVPLHSHRPATHIKSVGTPIMFGLYI